MPEAKTAALICRAQNPEFDVVKRLLYAMPNCEMPKKDFDSITESKFKGWTGTHYQMAKEMALYYTKDNVCRPRFRNKVTTIDILNYMGVWARKYYAPNPFTKDLSRYKEAKPTVLYSYFADCIQRGVVSFKEACDQLFGDIQLNNIDKVKLMLNSFTDIYVDYSGNMEFQKWSRKDIPSIEPLIDNPLDEESFFLYFGEIMDKVESDADCVQTIVYGCPGTGKSHMVKGETEGEHGEKTIWYDESGARVEFPTEEQKKTFSNNIFRTTFHPDYDYATFVGCYKPVKDEGGALDYKFVPQVFTNAYVTALRHPEDPVYLIIEEINRGNCAQIFGDLFQLLDRTAGVSDFVIKPDTELSKYLKSEKVPSESLCLPANLHIYATMNTSDQSLFPMDSAFKRRWAMEYKPIEYEHPVASKFTVTIAGKTYKWVDFLKWANFKIREATNSEDKQMGEFFIKSKNIEEKEFVNKVMFYLWNDVCKDYYNPRRVTQQFFMRITSPNENEQDYFTFAELFDKKRNAGSRLLTGFMDYLKAAYLEKHPDEADSATSTAAEA